LYVTITCRQGRDDKWDEEKEAKGIFFGRKKIDILSVIRMTSRILIAGKQKDNVSPFELVVRFDWFQYTYEGKQLLLP